MSQGTFAERVHFAQRVSFRVVYVFLLLCATNSKLAVAGKRPLKELALV